MEFCLRGGQRFNGRLTRAKTTRSESNRLVILAHGAANTMDHPLLLHLARGLAAGGISCLRFNFPYSQVGRPRPDPQPLLEEAWEHVLEKVTAQEWHSPEDRVVAAGKSMGGRVASQLASRGRLPVAGLIFYGYPLHPPGRPQELRDAHLGAIRVPMLFFSGTRDPFCRLDLMRGVIQGLGARARMVEIEDGDHSFALPQAATQGQAEVFGRILDRSLAWLLALAPCPAPDGPIQPPQAPWFLSDKAP